MQLLTRIFLAILILAMLAMFYPVAVAFHAYKPAAILALFFFLVFFLIPLAYLYRYGYFLRPPKK